MIQHDPLIFRSILLHYAGHSGRVFVIVVTDILLQCLPVDIVVKIHVRQLLHDKVYEL